VVGGPSNKQVDIFHTVISIAKIWEIRL